MQSYTQVTGVDEGYKYNPVSQTPLNAALGLQDEDTATHEMSLREAFLIMLYTHKAKLSTIPVVGYQRCGIAVERAPRLPLLKQHPGTS